MYAENASLCAETVARLTLNCENLELFVRLIAQSYVEWAFPGAATDTWKDSASEDHGRGRGLRQLGREHFKGKWSGLANSAEDWFTQLTK